MSTYGSLRANPIANETQHYLVSIAPDFAPPNYAEAATHRIAPSQDAQYWGGSHCSHADSSFWFWMWAFFSGNRPVVHPHHYAPMGRAATHGVSHAQAFGGVSPSHQDGMSGDERVAYGVASVALAAGEVAAHSYFNDKNEAASEKLDAVKSMRAKWEHVTPRAEDKRVHECLKRVLKAQEKVESGRTMRASIHKWSVVVIRIAGVALIIGAVVNSLPVFIAGIVVVVAGGVFAGVIDLIAVYTDDASAAKKVVRDYQIVSRHFLLPPEEEEGEEVLSRQQAEAWVERVAHHNVGSELPSAPPGYSEFPDQVTLDARMRALQVRELAVR